MEQEIPVYLFLGFLEAGKSTFIQETLEDARMETGEKLLLLVCEEGEVEYEPQKFAVKDVAIEVLQNANELTVEHLTALEEKHCAQRVIVEYNGTWLLQQFFDAMPDGWMIEQMMTFFDAKTFLNYNANMRQLVFDKIQLTQLVVFNRFMGEMNQQEYHKVVRAISRRTQIVYEYLGGKAVPDEIEDPLPFDKDANVIVIEDKDFALFHADLNENVQDYIGKIVSFKGLAATSKQLDRDCVVIGRHIMTCCEEDIAYDGFALKHNDLVKGIKTRDWLQVTAKIEMEYNAAYRGEGPVLHALKLERTAPANPELATFY